MLPTYENCVTPYLDRFPVVTLPDATRDRIKRFLNAACVAYCKKNNLRKLDNPAPWRSKYNIIAGEMVLDLIMDTNYTQLALNHNFSYQSKGFLEGQVVIKIFQKGEFPVIYQRNQSPFIFIMQEDEVNFRICGVATPQILQSFQNKALVPAGTYQAERKTCFYGFYELRSFEDLDELRSILKR